jgi:hypothetical protein
MAATGALQDEVQTLARRSWLSRYHTITPFTRKRNCFYAHNKSTAFLAKVVRKLANKSIMYTSNTECHLYRKKRNEGNKSIYAPRKIIAWTAPFFLTEFTSVKLHYAETEISAPLYMWQDRISTLSQLLLIWSCVLLWLSYVYCCTARALLFFLVL